MRNRPTGKSDESPVPSRAVIGLSTRSIASCTFAPKTIPVSPAPITPNATRRPMGFSPMTRLNHDNEGTARGGTLDGGSADGELATVDALGPVASDPPDDGPERLAHLAVRLRSNDRVARVRSEEHTSELQSHVNLVCRLLLEKKKK